MSDKPLHVTVEKLKRLNSNTPLKAFASVSINGKMKIHDCRVVQNPGGPPWVALPQNSYDKNGKTVYYAVIEVSDALKDAIQEAVLAEWRRA